ncbi:MAG: class I SAM-dependent methyltransferase [Actinomycetia bacterium]|nr:class I SAM-dependent methyltransferase [Actinomycetes bacterium]
MADGPQLNDSTLLAALADIQRRGAIGEGSLTAAVAHADQFVTAIPAQAQRLVDLGSGGGLPGLVIAVRRPALAITLVERRRSRADLLERAVRALRLDHVTVHSGDVREVAAVQPHSFDVVTARSFAAPEVTARWAGELLVPDGMLLVSEPPQPTAQRWPASVLRSAGLADRGPLGGIRQFQKSVAV